MDFYLKIVDEDLDINNLVSSVIQDPSILPILFEGVFNDKAMVRFVCQEILLEISKTKPDLIYPFFDAVIELLHHRNNIFVWSAITMIGNLASVDVWNKLDFHLPDILKMLNAGKMITANNTVEALGKIAAAKPQFTKQIIDELLKVKSYKYDTKECHNIVIGKVIDALSFILVSNGTVSEFQDVTAFVLEATKNARKSTREKAENFIKLLN